MAWLILILLPILSFANTCLETHMPISAAFIQENNFYQYKDGESNVLVARNFNNEVVGEIKLPRTIEKTDTFDLDHGIIYNSGENKYYFDFRTKEEFLIGPKDVQGHGNIYSTHIMFASVAGTTYLKPKTGKIFKIPPDIISNTAYGFIYYSKPNSENTELVTHLINEKGETQKISFPPNTQPMLMSDKHIIASDAMGAQTTYINQNGVWKKLSHKKNQQVSGVLPDGSYLITTATVREGGDPNSFNRYEYKTTVIDPSGKEGKTLPGQYQVMNSKVLKFDYSNGYTVDIPATSTDQFLRDVNAGREPVLNDRHSYMSPFLNFNTTDGVWSLKNENNLTYLLNDKTKKKIPLPFDFQKDVSVTSKGKYAVVSSFNESLMVDENGGIKRLSRAGSSYYFDEEGRFIPKLEKEVKTRICSQVQVVEDDCNCSIKSSLITETKALDPLTVKTACSLPFGDFDWNKHTPSVQDGEISKTQALLYLQRFQKPMGYNHDYLPILMSILASDVVEKNPREVLEAMKNIDPGVVNDLFNTFNLDKRLPTTAKPVASCRAKNEMPMSLADLANDIGPYSSLPSFLPYRYDYQDLSKEKKIAVVDQVAEGFSQMAAQDYILNSVFPSKLYYFSKKHVLKVFGEKSKTATDVSVSTAKKSAGVIILSSSPMDSGYVDMEKDDPSYGFYYRKVELTSVPDDAKVGTVVKQNLTWENQEGKYSAEVKMQVQEPLKDTIKQSKTPNYEAMKRDGEKTGLMVIGSNLAGNASLPDEYLTFYQNEGYEFEPAKNINAVKFLEDEVTSGRLDYFIKEAHSDGDDKNLFRMNNQGVLLKGTKVLADGTKEVMYILAPVANGDASTLISNQVFGSWIKKREADSPLYYFNASCSSYLKAIAEISAASSPNLVNIPTATLTYTFSTKKSNAMNAMMTGFLQEKDYEGIRTHMKTNSPKYASMRDDQFIFPDEERYESYVTSNLQQNLDTQVTVKDSSGKEIHMDEQLDHD